MCLLYDISYKFGLQHDSILNLNVKNVEHWKIINYYYNYFIHTVLATFLKKNLRSIRLLFKQKCYLDSINMTQFEVNEVNLAVRVISTVKSLVHEMVKTRLFVTAC